MKAKQKSEEMYMIIDKNDKCLMLTASNKMKEAWEAFYIIGPHKKIAKKQGYRAVKGKFVWEEK